VGGFEPCPTEAWNGPGQAFPGWKGRTPRGGIWELELSPVQNSKKDHWAHKGEVTSVGRPPKSFSAGFRPRAEKKIVSTDYTKNGSEKLKTTEAQGPAMGLVSGAA